MPEIFDERFDIDGDSEHVLYNEHLLRYQFAAKFATGKKVLDIASGTGYGSRLLAMSGASSVLGLDLDSASVKKANQDLALANLRYQEANAESFPQINESFDMIVSFETIEHLEHPENYLAELVRVAKNEALVMISTPNKVISKERNPFHVREYTEAEFLSELKPYFKYVDIIFQNNGIASYIGNGKGEFGLTTDSTPLYFVAICSQRPIEIPSYNLASINPAALVRIRKNPALRASNFLYRILRKLGIV